MVDVFYIYCHRKKTDGKCFYIGKGIGYRYKNKHNRNNHWKNIVNKHDFTWEILINNISEEKAFELESKICKQIGYENLCNINQEKGNGGWTRSIETILKLKKPKPKGMMNKIHLNNKKPIIQYDLKGNPLKEWTSSSDAGRSLNKRSQAISECCQNKRKTAYGYNWGLKYL